MSEEILIKGNFLKAGSRSLNYVNNLMDSDLVKNVKYGRWYIGTVPLPYPYLGANQIFGIESGT